MKTLFHLGFCAIFLALAFSACDSKPVRISYNTAFDAHLSAFTDGEISKKSPVMIRFAKDVAADTKAAVPKGVFSISPNIDGDLRWIDQRTLEFKPNTDLASGVIYTATVQMNKLIADISSELSTFEFQFRAKEQFINVSPMAATASMKGDDKFMQLQGKVQTRDVESGEAIEKIFSAFGGSTPLDVTWEHLDEYTHVFTINDVKRGESAYDVNCRWNGKALKMSNPNGDISFKIPSTDEFVLNKTYRYNSPEQHIVLEFSDILDANQDLSGLVTLGGKKLKYTIEGNKVKVYPDQKLLGKYKLQVSGDIRSMFGKTTGSPDTEDITFSDAKPAAKWVGNGSIIPNSKSMPIVFQTINVNAVDVRVIKIKEDNVVQFFQVNVINGDEQLKRVGTEVLRKKFDLSQNKELNLAEWTTHSLDLATLIQPEQGAIYEIAIGFRKSYSLFQCTGSAALDADGNVMAEDEKDMLALGKNWDLPSTEYSYWDYYEEGFEYEDLQDPCKQAYFNGERTIRRNVLGSDLGILAKRGDNDNLFVVNNLQTTEPMSGVELELYDFHQNIIARAKTDNKGMAKIDVANLSNVKPFMVVAKSGKQRGYLRLDQGTALNMSRFDIAGAKYEKGLKGFIYGERGVWRPGDELFINFILEDKDKALPANHPVVFELKDPKGALVAKRSSTSGMNGFYNFTCRTEESAVTGNYTATVKVGGATFTKNIKIESIKPNRLKIALDFGTEPIALTKSASGKLKATWLHGAPGKMLKANVEMTLKASNAGFKGYNDFEFNDPARNVNFDGTMVFENKLNAEGEATIPLNIKEKIQAPGPLKAVFNTQVFEEGGDFSIDQLEVPAHIYNTYVGIRAPKGDLSRDMLLTDKKHAIEIATVDTKGAPVSKEKITVSFYKLDWRWWFAQDKNEVSAWNGKVNSTAISEEVISTTNGVGTWNLEVKYPEWGRYLIRACDGSGHCSGKVVYVDWPGWAGRSSENDPSGASALNFTTDKPQYNVGETVTLNIPTGFAGRALVTIENNSKILSAQWIDATKGTTKYTFQATKEMSPNVYAYVTLLQPHAQTKNDLPIRMYGVQGIKIEDPQTRLEPLVDVASELQPLKDFTVSVSERRGGAMTYTVAIVDEGLLDLTRFKTPSPWETFYQRMALGVRTWDMYNDVLGAYSGQLKSMLSIGGDDAINNAANKKQDRFKPVVIYAGPFTVGKGDKKSHTFKMPNYVGSVRVMVVAAQDAAYGSTEKAVPVRQPLMVVASLPRVLGPEESITLPVTVFSMKEDIKNVDISLQSNELFEVIGDSKKSVAINGIGDGIVFFEIKTKARAGLGNIRVTAKGGVHEAVYNTDITVRNPNPATTNVASNDLTNGNTWSSNYTPIGMIGTNSANLEVSVIPPMNLAARLQYLIKYPYGCIEQTTSGAFPQLYVGQFTELSAQQKESIEKNIKVAITKLQRFQRADGGFGYWMGAYENDNWATNYVGHFFVEAQKAGYNVPADMMDKWVKYQVNTAANWVAKATDGDDIMQAYRLYTLALAGKGDISSMNRMRSTRIDKASNMSRWYLATAYALSGQKDVAKNIIATAAMTIPMSKAHDNASTFGTTFRDQAMLVQALSTLDERGKAESIVKILADRLASNDWLSTQETAQALIAMSKYIGNDGSRNFAFEYRIGSEGTWVKVNSKFPIWQQPLDGERTTKIEFRNTSGATIFPRIISEGTPKAGEESAVSKGLDISIEYKNKNAKVDYRRMPQSDNFFAAVTVKNTAGHNLNELAISHILPSGWEITNLTWGSDDKPSEKPEFQDIRDDRVYTFFDLKKGESKTFVISLNSTYLGKYYLPGVVVESMYDKATQARSKGEWVEVVKKSNN
jgi:alpha-2-macroglobulin